MTIKRNVWNEPVCSDCERAFDAHETVIEIDGDILCMNCIRAWAADSLSDLVYELINRKAELYSGTDIQNFADDEDNRIQDEMARVMRGDER